MNKKNEKPSIPVIVGPTAVGKTGICVDAGSKSGFEIISCDSRQIYRKMNIGTAKPDPGQLTSVKHHLVDILDPDDAYSAHDWATDAERVIQQSLSAGRHPVIVGGTGFYLRSLIEGLSPSIPADPQFRKMCEKKVQIDGVDSIFKELERVDPTLARKLHPNDIQRGIRALEVFHATGRPPSELKKHTRPPHALSFRILILTISRDVLYDRINTRVDAMIRDGLWEEFLSLIDQGYSEQSPGMRCVGYQELFAAYRGAATPEKVVEQIKRNTRRFAKRQLTWFRHQTKGQVLDLTGQSSAHVAGYVERFINNNA